MSLKIFLSKKQFLLSYFFVAWFVLYIIYFKGHEAMLVDDGINGLLVLQQKGFDGFWNSYNTNCFYYSFWTFLWLLYKSCGSNTIYWFFFFSGMHALNTTLLFNFFRQLYSDFAKIMFPESIAFLGSLLFLLSPFMSENIMWTATHHYAIACSLMLVLITMLLQFLRNKFSILNQFIFYLLFSISITTHEITFFFPFLMLFIFLFVKKVSTIGTPSFVQFLKKILIPIGMICITYLLFLHQVRGLWVPHYYANEVQIASYNSLINFLQYHIRFLFFVHHLSPPQREYVYKLAEKWQLGILIYSLVIGVVIYFLSKKYKENRYLFLLLFACSNVLLIPVLQLNFTSLFTYESDRYLYFFSVFCFQAIAFFFFQFKKFIRVPLLIVYFTILLFFTFKSAIDKITAAKYISDYKSKFKDKPNSNTYIFNMPCAVENQRLFYYADGFTQLYGFIHHTDISQRVFNVMSVVCSSAASKVDAKWLTDSSVQFQLQTNGEWYYMNTLGGMSYENEHFKCEIEEYSKLILTIKNRQPQDRILTFESGEFIEIKK